MKSESLIYFLAKCFSLFLRNVSVSVAMLAGDIVGMGVYYFDHKHKAQIYANLKMAFGHEKSPLELKYLTRKALRNYGRLLIETLRMPVINKNNFDKYFEVNGKENVEKAVLKGCGVIVLVMHWGNWEMASMCSSMLGFPYTVMFKPQKKFKSVTNLFNRARSSHGAKIVYPDISGSRDVIKALRNKEVVGMVADQGGEHGVLFPFFGRNASFSTGAVRMAIRTGAAVCFSTIQRIKDGRHRMVFSEPVFFDDKKSEKEQCASYIKGLVQKLESCVRSCPDEYMWLYKVWKYSDYGKIVIISDKRVGHLRQSEAVAKITQRILQEKGIRSDIEIVEVDFKKGLGNKLFSLWGALAFPFLGQGDLYKLKHFLTEESYRKIAGLKASFVISTGSSVAGLNFLVSRENKAKSFVVLKPGLLKPSFFDFNVMPQHDIKKKLPKNVSFAVTKAAPNLISEQYLNNQKQALLDRFSHLKTSLKTKIGVFIGGDSKNIYISEGQIKVLIQQLKEVCRQINAELLITTSRRTPEKIESLLYKQLKKDPLCPLLILANKENVREAVGGILGLSDIVIVSGDSISMVSEAASSGRQVIVFSPIARVKSLQMTNKHKIFIEKLNEQGYILSSSLNNISQSVLNIAKAKIQTRTLQDSKIIYEGLNKIIKNYFYS